MTACSALQNMDASCSEECDASAAGKPADNSEWVWTVLQQQQLLSSSGGRPLAATSLVEVENPTGGRDGLPNQGCRWRCKEGYALVDLDAGMGTGVLDFLDEDSTKIWLCAKRRI